MFKNQYLQGCIYHMVHIDNLRSIFQQRALLSHEQLKQKKIVPHSIAYQDVQELRNRILIQASTKQRFLPLHTYVPFYFAKRPPMLHVPHNRNKQDELIFLEVNRTILKETGVLFTDGNATNQQLSQQGQEIVIIKPATINTSCSRTYLPDGPYGTGQTRSDFYSNINFLRKLNWDGINQTHFIEDREEFRRVRAAEVLVPDYLPLEKIQDIFTYTREMAQTVNKLIYACGLARKIPSATINTSLFLP